MKIIFYFFITLVALLIAINILASIRADKIIAREECRMEAIVNNESDIANLYACNYH